MALSVRLGKQYYSCFPKYKNLLLWCFGSVGSLLSWVTHGKKSSTRLWECQKDQQPSDNHRNIEWFGHLKDPTPTATCRDIFCKTRLLRAASSLSWDTAREGQNSACSRTYRKALQSIGTSTTINLGFAARGGSSQVASWQQCFVGSCWQARSAERSSQLNFIDTLVCLRVLLWKSNSLPELRSSFELAVSRSQITKVNIKSKSFAYNVD